MKKLVLTILILIALSAFIFGACVYETQNASFEQTIIDGPTESNEPNEPTEPNEPNEPIYLGEPIEFTVLGSYSNAGSIEHGKRVFMATDVRSLRGLIRDDLAAEPIFEYFDEDYFIDNNVIFHFYVHSGGTASITTQAIYVTDEKILVDTISKGTGKSPAPAVVYDYGLVAIKVSKADIGDRTIVEEI